MPLKLAGLTFDVVPDLVFVDDQPLPTIRSNIVVNAKVTGAEAARLKKAIDDDERAVLETPNGRGEVEVRAFVYAPGEGVVKHFEGPELRSWSFTK